MGTRQLAAARLAKVNKMLVNIIYGSKHQLSPAATPLPTTTTSKKSLFMFLLKISLFLNSQLFISMEKIHYANLLTREFTCYCFVFAVWYLDL